MFLSRPTRSIDFGVSLVLDPKVDGAKIVTSKYCVCLPFVHYMILDAYC